MHPGSIPGPVQDRIFVVENAAALDRGVSLEGHPVQGRRSFAKRWRDDPDGALASGIVYEALDTDADDSHRFLLKYVSLESHTLCNQACYFCPVSISPRDHYFMPTELYELIVAQLAEYRATIEAISPSAHLAAR